MKAKTAAAATVAFTVLLASTISAAADQRPRRRRPAAPPPLVWHVESLDGQSVETRQGSDAINPASVVKVATSLWALERLGPNFRFDTRFFARGEVDATRGVVFGDLVVIGGGDPDFHAENALLIARALNQLGVREVTGALVVNRQFWMGWENGSAGMSPDPMRRGLVMASRLRQALDSGRWNASLRRSWRQVAGEHGWSGADPPRVVVRGGVGVDGDGDRGELLAVHRSESLADALRRFNCYSNNDIERVAAGLGPIEELAALVAVRCDAEPGEIALETASGLGTNRMSPRTIVRLLREFRYTCRKNGLTVEDLLPVAGCDPGTVTRFFPRLSEGSTFASVAAKTGTLTITDGGVVVLAGFASTASGELVFCVAAPRARGRLEAARKEQERWLLELIARFGGPAALSCAAPLATSDADASIITVWNRVGAGASGTASR